MARITLPEPETLAGFLKEIHDTSPTEDWSTKHVARAFAANPSLLEDFMTFYSRWHSNDGGGLLDTRLKELIRLRVATLNGCKTCKASREEPTVTEEEASRGVDSPEFNFAPRERAALQLAEKMALDHFSIDDDEIHELKKHFSEGELLELLVMTGQYIGFGRALSILQLEDVTCPV